MNRNESDRIEMNRNESNFNNRNSIQNESKRIGTNRYEPKTVHLPPDLIEKIEQVAKEEETSFSSIIRRAVKEFLRRREGAEN